MTDSTTSPAEVSPSLRRFPTAAPDGLVAAVLLSFLATAGLFYVNIMSAIVDGLVSGLGISDSAAGLIGSANIYGAAIGAFIAATLVHRVAWRRAAVICLIGLIAIDLISIKIVSSDALLVVRLIHGIVGGFLVGLGFAIIARTKTPDRTFGMLLFVQFGLGGLGQMMLPKLVPLYGTQSLFLSLAAFSAVTLLMVPFLADYPPRAHNAAASQGKILWTPLLLNLAAIFLFQAANMALLAYIIRLGIEYGLSRDYVSDALGLATWIALVGPLFVMIVGLRYGRFWPLAAAMILTLVGTALFHWSGDASAYLIANAGTGITWGFVIAYLLGMSSEFDQAGRMAALGGFVSKMGLASGPLLASRMLQAGTDFETLINVAVLGLALSTVVMLIPAFMLDRRRTTIVNATTLHGT